MMPYSPTSLQDALDLLTRNEQVSGSSPLVGPFFFGFAAKIRQGQVCGVAAKVFYTSTTPI